MNNLLSILISFYLSLKAVGHNFIDPITWASGTRNPFYVDDRIIISHPHSRALVKSSLGSLIINPENIHYMYGIPTAGIAPAVLLCMETNKPLLLKLNGKYFAVDIEGLRELIKTNSTEFMRSADAVAGTVPFGIVMGVIAAEEMNKTFLFVRPKAKDHGTKKQIEGITESVKYTLLFDPIYPEVENYSLGAMHSLRAEGMEILNMQTPDISQYIKEVDLNGKKVVTVEDLVSTGGSSMKENEDLLDKGAEVFPVSIFDYQLPEAVEGFAKRGLKNESVLNFNDLMDEYSKTISIDDAEELFHWHKTQRTWGYDNGFK